eukprot:jgi/Bigna1/130385/aug1.11_g5093
MGPPQALAAALKKNRTLQTVLWAGVNATDKGILALAAALATNATVSVIDISHNQIGDRNFGAICDAVASNEHSAVETIHAWQIGITSKVFSNNNNNEDNNNGNAESMMICAGFSYHVFGFVRLLYLFPPVLTKGVYSVVFFNAIGSKERFAAATAQPKKGIGVLLVKTSLPRL